MRRLILAAVAALWAGSAVAGSVWPSNGNRAAWSVGGDDAPVANFANRTDVFPGKLNVLVNIDLGFIRKDFANPNYNFGGTFKKFSWLRFTGTLDLMPDGISPRERDFYYFSGTLTAANKTGNAYLTFDTDGTWECTGDCYSYAWMGTNLERSLTPYTTGVYMVSDIPIPATGLLLAAGLGAFGIRRRWL